MVDGNIVTRGWQELIPVFPLGAVAQHSLSYCSWRLLELHPTNNKPPLCVRMHVCMHICVYICMYVCFSSPFLSPLLTLLFTSFFPSPIPCIFCSLSLTIRLSGISLESSEATQGRCLCPSAQYFIRGHFRCAVHRAMLGPEHQPCVSKVSPRDGTVAMCDFEANGESHIYF